MKKNKVEVDFSLERDVVLGQVYVVSSEGNIPIAVNYKGCEWLDSGYKNFDYLFDYHFELAINKYNGYVKLVATDKQLGYKSFQLFNPDTQRMEKCYVHKIVAYMYIDKENKSFVKHKDGNKSNNNLDNLYFVK